MNEMKFQKKKKKKKKNYCYYYYVARANDIKTYNIAF